MELDQVNQLVERLEGSSEAGVELIETHISWVLLAGECAYKIKKPVDYGFLDFSTLEKRQFFSEEELRLNRRFSKDLYQSVVPIVLEKSGVNLYSDGQMLSDDHVLIDYAVKMKRFRTSDAFDQVYLQQPLEYSTCESLAQILASFHQDASVAGKDTEFGSAQLVFSPMQDNFAHLNQHFKDEVLAEKLLYLSSWSDNEFKQLEDLLVQRKMQGFIRECHGDLHLGNITWFEGRITFFDCIEFEPKFRWIDTVNELAFLLMDFEYQGGYQQANWTLNTYLTHTGDYAGLKLLNFYKVYRALVRAKVSELTYASLTKEAKASVSVDSNNYLAECLRYVDLAISYTKQKKSIVVMMQGVSGSGKSTVAREIAATLCAIHLRSDVERKRLFGLAPKDSSHLAAKDIYNPSATEKTFSTLLEITGEAVKAGFSVVLDTTLITRRLRQPFIDYAKQHNILAVIVHCDVPFDQIKDWISDRIAKGNDPSEATLEVVKQQIEHFEPVVDEEGVQLLRLDVRSIDKRKRLIKWLSLLK